MKKMRRLRSPAVVLLAGWVLWRLVAGVDAARLRLVLDSLGPLLPLLLLPFLVATSLDTLGSRILLGRALCPPPFLDLLGVRLIAEAVVQSLPTGSLLADGLAPRLLRDRCGVPWPEGIASVAARKAVLVAAQASFLALAVASWAIGMSGRPGTLGLAVAALLAAAAILLLIRGFWSSAARGTLAVGLARLAHALPSRFIRLWLARRRTSLREIDLHLGHVLGRGEAGLGFAFAAYAAMCLVEALETFCVLRLLGSPLDLVAVLPWEATLSWLRATAFFVPGGLGVQDLGGVAFLHAAGVPEATAIGAAWMLLKRGKEAFWIAIGYLLLARWRHSRVV